MVNTSRRCDRWLIRDILLLVGRSGSLEMKRILAEIDMHAAAVRDSTFQQFGGQTVLQLLLDDSLQRSRTERRIKAQGD